MNSLISPKCVFYAVIACTICFASTQSEGQVKVIPYDQVKVVPSDQVKVVPHDKPKVIPYDKPQVVPYDKPKVIPYDKPKVVPYGKPKVIPYDQVKVVPYGNKEEQAAEKVFTTELPPIVTESAAAIDRILAPKTLPEKIRQIPNAPEILVTREGNRIPSNMEPAIKPLNPKKLEELPPVKSWEQKASAVESFANPQKPLPVIHRSKAEPIIDTANQMMITIPKSSLKADQPILYTQQPNGFEQPAAYEQGRPHKVQSGAGSQVPIRPIQGSVQPLPRSAPKTVQFENGSNWRAKSQVPASSTQVAPAELKKQIESFIDRSRKTNSTLLPATASTLPEQQLNAGAVSEIEFNTEERKTPVSKKVIGRQVSNPFVSPVKLPAEIETLGNGRLPEVKPISSRQHVMPKTSVVQENVIPSDELIVLDDGVVDDGVVMGQATFPRTPFAVLRGEALFIARERGETGVSNAFRLDPFDHELGIRIHAERLFGVSGRSLTYSGLQEWNEVQRVAGGGLGINPVSGGLPAGTLTPFAGAIFQQHSHRANMHTLELNNVTWGWDVLNLFWGFRFTHYEEELSFFSARADGQQGLLDLDLENNMFGPQVGAEVFYDIGTRFSTGVKGKFGVMANAFEGQTLLISNGVRQINNADTEVELNIMAELGIFARLRLGPRAYLRGGYELWYNSAVFGATDNIPGVITPGFGAASIDGDLFIHGATAGIEFVW